MIHIIRHKEYDFPIPSGYVTCDVGPMFKENPREYSYCYRPNVNELNPVINELTGIIDVANNFDDKIVGFCHYHRFFTKDDKILEFSEAVSMIYPRGKYDFILAHHVEYPDMTIRESLERDFREDLPTFNKYMDMLYEKDPDLKDYFNGRMFHPRNMFVCERNLLLKYVNWLTWLLIPVAYKFKAEDFHRYPHYYSRMIGFIAERLLSYFVYKHGYRYIELPYNEF